MSLEFKYYYYKKLLARSLDFVPVIGPFLMMVGYVLGRDLISKKHFHRVSRKGFGFLGSAIFTLIVNFFFFGKLFELAGRVSFPFDMTETATATILLAIAGYTCHAVFLGIDLFQDTEERLAKRIPLIRRWKEKQDGNVENKE